MRRIVFVTLVFSLLVTVAFVQKSNIPTVKAASPIYQGDLVIVGSNVTTIEGRFDINGSIIVEENATLILNNAFLNLTLTSFHQHNITLRNASKGNPRLLAFNSTIASRYFSYIHLFDNSTVTVDNSTIFSMEFLPKDNSFLSISNSNVDAGLESYDSSITIINNSTLYTISARGNSEVYASGSESLNAHIRADSVNCSISNLGPGLLTSWSFLTNGSVNFLPGGYTPNVTFVDTEIKYSWGFTFSGSSTVSFENSTIGQATGADNSTISLKATHCQQVDAFSDSIFVIEDSTIGTISFLHEGGSPKCWLLNSTYQSLYLNELSLGQVHVSWYLEAHVIDTIGQDVPSANVTFTYQNATIVKSKLTDANGMVKLTLKEKMMNVTGEYPVGNYTVEATYDIHSDDTTINMTGNKHVLLMLEPFIIPEFPSFLVIPLFIMATLLAFMRGYVQKKKAKSDKLVKSNITRALD